MDQRTSSERWWRDYDRLYSLPAGSCSAQRIPSRPGGCSLPPALQRKISGNPRVLGVCPRPADPSRKRLVLPLEGAKESLLLGFSLLLVLDDILRGGSLKPEREELILSAVLAVSALTDYTLVIALPAVFIYRAYRGGFGRGGALYFGGAWFGASLTLVYALKSRLPGPGAEASIIAAVSLAFLFIAERKEVGGLNEVGVLEEK